jgi:ATP-dependent RNA helicase DOB1
LRVFLPKDLRTEQSRETVWKSVLEVQRRFPDGIPLLDPIKEMKIKDDKFTALVQVIISLSILFSHQLMFISENRSDRR